jgi:hypothetical protein
VQIRVVLRQPLLAFLRCTAKFAVLVAEGLSTLTPLTDQHSRDLGHTSGGKVHTVVHHISHNDLVAAISRRRTSTIGHFPCWRVRQGFTWLCRGFSHFHEEITRARSCLRPDSSEEGEITMEGGKSACWIQSKQIRQGRSRGETRLSSTTSMFNVVESIQFWNHFLGLP